MNSDHMELRTNGFVFTRGYGVSKRVDVKLGLGYRFSRYQYDSAGYVTNSRKAADFTGISLESKVNLFTQNKWRPELALSGNYFYSSLGGDMVGLVLSWSYRLGDKFRLGGNFASNNVDSELDGNYGFFDSFNYTVNARYEFVKGIGVFADIRLPNSLESYSAMPDFGVYYRVNSNMQFHMRYNQLMSIDNNPTQLYNLGGGFSCLFFNY